MLTGAPKMQDAHGLFGLDLWHRTELCKFGLYP